MVAGKMRAAMGLQKSPKHHHNTTTTTNTTAATTVTPPPKPPKLPSPSPSSGKTNSNSSSKGGAAFSRYFPRSSSAQVQPRPPDISELLRLVEDLRERESRLKTELLEHKLVKESAAVIPLLENEIASRNAEISVKSKRIEALEAENEKVRVELEQCRLDFEKDKREKECRIKALQEEIFELKKTASFRGKAEMATTTTPSVSFESTSSDDLSLSQRFLSMKNARRAPSLKCSESIDSNSNNDNNNNNNNNNNSQRFQRSDSTSRREESTVEIERPRHSGCNSEELADSAESTHLHITRSRAPRVPKPPPKRCSSSPPSISVEVSENAPPPPPPPPPPPHSPCISGSSTANSVAAPPPPPPPPPPTRGRAPLAPLKAVPPPPAPPPPPPAPAKKTAPPPPPPPPKSTKALPEKVRRVPEVVEFYHSLMRRDSRRDSSGGVGAEGPPSTANARDMIGEIENRSAHLLAIKTDVETQGDFIRFLIKEVENAAFTNIEDVVPFVKWLDDELSYLVDERAVLKHFDWPEQKADALREAAFGYCDLKKLESEASSFRDDNRQPCGPALKKMQALFEKLEHGVYNLSRMRESAVQRYRTYQIPMDWMLDNGIVSQIKLASVKLALKYMKRVSAELESIGCGPEEEELIVQGVRFAFRVHQFASGFDVETMKAFQELKEKARSCHVQCQGPQQHPKFVCRSTPC